MDHRQIIADEIEFQKKRLYKRLKTSDNGRLIVEYWKGAENFLNKVHGINWKLDGQKILIKEDKKQMKTFKSILEGDRDRDLNEKFKIGDKVKILDSPSKRKHGQDHGIGQTGEIESMSGNKIWVAYGKPSEKRQGMGYARSTIQVEPGDLKKLKESKSDDYEAIRYFGKARPTEANELRQKYYAIGDAMQDFPGLVNMLNGETGGFGNDLKLAKQLKKIFDKISLGKYV
jgi:hypothetical protein